MTTSFTLSWDYRCPFARNAHEHVLAGLEAGADWNVSFSPFALDQAHVADGEPEIFDQTEYRPSLLGLAAGVTVRDHHPDRFAAFHKAMFSARHDEARDIRAESVVRAVLGDQGLDADGVVDKFDESVAKIRDEHMGAVEEHQMFGVPTFVIGDRAVFVRLMDRAGPDPQASAQAIEGVLRTVEGMPNLNEYKFTKIPR
ncbi:MAG: DsbA family protein [Actinobacteria bacterium]|nr:DsbA family protein [Actinomycetota bacterium]